VGKDATLPGHAPATSTVPWITLWSARCKIVRVNGKPILPFGWSHSTVYPPSLIGTSDWRHQGPVETTG